MNVSRERLIDEFQDQEYREAYAEGFTSTCIAAQLTVLREQRGLTQKQLAKMLGLQQEGISRIESEDYGRWSLATLRKVGFGLGTRLRVSFETFGSLVDEALDFSRGALQRPSFEEDPVFQETGIRRPVIQWLDTAGEPEQLRNWLQGRDLQGAGSDEDGYLWVLRAVKGDEQRRSLLAGRVAEELRAAPDVKRPGRRPEQLLRNLLYLAAGLDEPQTLADPLLAMYGRLGRSQADWSPGGRAALLASLTMNQADEGLRKVWKNMVLHRGDALLGGNEYSGFTGFEYLPERPNVPAIAEGIKLMESHSYGAGQSIGVDGIARLIAGVVRKYGGIDRLAERMMSAAYACKWMDLPLIGYVKAVAPEQPCQRKLVDETSPGVKPLMIGAILAYREYTDRSTNRDEAAYLRELSLPHVA